MLPEHLAVHVRLARALGVEPMTEDDGFRLRTIGKVFWPEQFDWRRAGLTAPVGVRA